MKISKLALSLLSVFICTQANAQSLELFLKEAPQLVSALNIIREETNETLRLIERKMNSSHTIVSSMTAEERVKAIDSIGRAKSALQKARGTMINLRSLSLESGRSRDHFGSVSTVIGTHREIETASNMLLDPKSELTELVSALKQTRFFAANMSGNLMETLAHTVGPIGQLQLDRAELIQSVQDLHSSMKATFENAKKPIQLAKPGSGARVITYVNGSSFGTAADIGPSPYTAEEALKIEQGALNHLSQELRSFETQGALAGWLNVNRKTAGTLARCARTIVPR